MTDWRLWREKGGVLNCVAGIVSSRERCEACGERVCQSEHLKSFRNPARTQSLCVNRTLHHLYPQ